MHVTVVIGVGVKVTAEAVTLLLFIGRGFGALPIVKEVSLLLQSSVSGL